MLALLLAALMGGLTASALDTNPVAPIVGYKVVNLTWNVVPQVSGAQPVNVTGSLETVIDYLNTTYVNYPFPVYPSFNSSNVTSNAAVNSSGTVDYCFNYPQAGVDHIWDGIQYLLGIDGEGANGPGPGSCGRVSCSYNSAIWWCNDNEETFAVSFEDIGFSAWHIVDNCYDSEAHFGIISGQNFYNTGWNVIVRGDTC